VSGSDEAAIVVEDSDRTTVSDNRMLHNSGAIILVGDGNAVVGNTIADVPQCAAGGCGYGISVEGGARNLVAENTVLAAGFIGIRLDASAPPATGNVIRDNVVRDAGLDGIAINPEEVGPVLDTLLEGNLAIGAADDGIDVNSSATTLRSNRAVGNGDLGIDAVPGVIDAGGNKARANGNPLQCSNVLCT
jgi:parallel beta-helix repeat protein